MSLGPRLRELIDRVTDELAADGRTNLIRLSSGDAQIDEAVLTLRPAGLAILAAAPYVDRDVPGDIGIIAVDNTIESGMSQPTLTTVNLDVSFSAHEIVRLLREGHQFSPRRPSARRSNHMRPIRSATRMALAMAVRPGLKPPFVGCSEASATYTLLVPHKRPRSSQAPDAGVRLMRTVPAECSEPCADPGKPTDVIPMPPAVSTHSRARSAM